MIEHVQSGEPFAPSAKRENEIADAVNAWMRDRFGNTSDVRRWTARTDWVRAQNDAGAQVRQGEILAISTSHPLPSPVAETIQSFRGITPPVDCTPHIGVAINIIGSGKVDFLAVSGTVPALVDVLDESHEYARAVGGSRVLQSSERGDVRIQWKPAGTGELLCSVVLHGQQPPVRRFILLEDLYPCGMALARGVLACDEGETFYVFDSVGAVESLKECSCTGTGETVAVMPAGSNGFAAWLCDSQQWELVTPGSVCCTGTGSTGTGSTGTGSTGTGTGSTGTGTGTGSTGTGTGSTGTGTGTGTGGGCDGLNGTFDMLLACPTSDGSTATFPARRLTFVDGCLSAVDVLPDCTLDLCCQTGTGSTGTGSTGTGSTGTGDGCCANPPSELCYRITTECPLMEECIGTMTAVEGLPPYDQEWAASGPWCETGPGNSYVVGLFVRCAGGVYTLELNLECPDGSETATATLTRNSCSPFNLTGSFTFPGPCCETYTADITIAETGMCSGSGTGSTGTGSTGSGSTGTGSTGTGSTGTGSTGTGSICCDWPTTMTVRIKHVTNLNGQAPSAISNVDIQFNRDHTFDEGGVVANFPDLSATEDCDHAYHKDFGLVSTYEDDLNRTHDFYVCMFLNYLWDAVDEAYHANLTYYVWEKVDGTPTTLEGRLALQWSEHNNTPRECESCFAFDQVAPFWNGAIWSNAWQLALGDWRLVSGQGAIANPFGTNGTMDGARCLPASAGSGVSIPYRETPSGTIDGTNRTFTLSYTPVVVQIFVNGVMASEGIDYIRDGDEIEFVVDQTPETGDTLEAFSFL